MPKVNLTEISVRKLTAPAKGQATYWDKSSPLGLRLSQGGSRTFIVMTGSGKRQTIGSATILSLSEARTAAKRALAEKTLGLDKEKALPFSEAQNAFLKHSEASHRPQTTKSYRRRLKHFPFGKTMLSEITPQEIIRKLDKLKDRPSERQHAMVTIKVFFSWCVSNFHVKANPCQPFRQTLRPPRQRALSDDELKAVLEHAYKRDDLYARILLLILLCGQRPGETARLKWAYINLEEQTITFPAEITKNKRITTFPFGSMTAELLERIPRLDSSEYLFPARTTDDKPFNGWSKCGPKFRKDLKGVGHFTPHDCRRSLSTGMASLGIAPHLIERFLNHVTGESLSAVARTYNVYQYMPEMRDAIARWENHLQTLLKSG